MTKEQKEWIDNASYTELLTKWRFAPSGDPMFIEAGKYFSEVMKFKRNEIGHDAHTTISKAIGWGDI